MTVASTVNKNVYNGDGATSVFPYTFKIFANTDLVVTEIVVSTGVETDLALTTNYTVSGVGVVTGGNVTLVAGALPDTKKLVIKRTLPLVQGFDLEENDNAPSSSSEAAYDKLTMMVQQIDEAVSRAIKVSVGSTLDLSLPLPEAGAAIGWNDAGDDLTNNPTNVSDSQVAAAASAAAAAASEAAAAGSAAVASNEAASAAVSAAEAAASAAAINLPTIQVGDALKFLRVKADRTGYDFVSGILNSKIGFFTRDQALASGTQEIIGVGFEPSVVYFFGTEGTVLGKGYWGLDDGTLHFGLLDYSGVTEDTYSSDHNYSIVITESAVNNYAGVISALGADGFTISWARTAAPTGVAFIYYLALA